VIKTVILKYSFFVLLLVIAQPVFSQLKQFKLDSLHQKFKKDSTWIFRPKKVFPLVTLDQRNSFLHTAPNSNSPVNIWGAKGGVTLLDRHNLGIGGYSIQNASKRPRPKDGGQTNQNLTFQYLTVFYEYSFVNTRWWEIGIPVEAGFGFYKTINTDVKTNQFLGEKRGSVFPLGTALDIYFKPTRWFALNVMGGYRHVINNTSRLNLSGWFYSIGGAVFIRQIFQDSRYVFKKHAYKEEIKKINLLPD